MHAFGYSANQDVKWMHGLSLAWPYTINSLQYVYIALHESASFYIRLAPLFIGTMQAITEYANGRSIGHRKKGLITN